MADQLDSLESWGMYHYEAKAGCVESIEARDSRQEIFLQLLDVPLGALTALRNKRELIGAKRELADYVAAKFAHKNIEGNCGRKVQDFAIWNAAPNHRIKRGPWG